MKPRIIKENEGDSTCRYCGLLEKNKQLKEYAQHKGNCPARIGEIMKIKPDCICGLDDLLKDTPEATE